MSIQGEKIPNQVSATGRKRPVRKHPVCPPAFILALTDWKRFLLHSSMFRLQHQFTQAIKSHSVTATALSQLLVLVQISQKLHAPWQKFCWKPPAIGDASYNFRSSPPPSLSSSWQALQRNYLLTVEFSCNNAKGDKLKCTHV